MKKHLAIGLFLSFTLVPGVFGAPDSPPGAAVQVEGKTLFTLHTGVGSFTAEERAQAVNQRLSAILAAPLPKINIGVEKNDIGLRVTNDGKAIIAVTDADAREEKTKPDELAGRWAKAMDNGLQQASSAQERATLWRRILTTGAVLGGAFLAFLFIFRVKGALLAWIETKRERLPQVRFRELVLLTAAQIHEALLRGIWAIHLAAVVVVGGISLLMVFNQIPSTRQYARQVLFWILNPLSRIFWGAVGYLPNLFYILVIVAVTRLGIRGLNFLFDRADRGVISLEPWVHRDVARPTFMILRAILLLLALFFIAPLVPGTGTTAAQGITVLLGLMVSFGSTSTVGNIIAGIVLTYMRPFQIGDRVKIGDTTGDVIEKTFLYTKVETIKNEEVVVPSLQVLGVAMVNYSAKAQRAGLILHTSVTIGYDSPWRTVHELLLRAADRTEGVMKEPKPFVLQTSLDDWYVSYQINAFTQQPNRMATIYSDLHQNIQDSFNEGGVEILSPHYLQLRDGNATTIPEKYQKDYVPPRFLVDARFAPEK